MSFVFYALGHRPPDVHSRCYVPVIAEAHTAKQWLDKMIAGKEFTRTGDILWLKTDQFNFTVRCEQLDEVLRAPISNEPLRDDMAKNILRFKYGTWDETHVREDEDEPGADTPGVERAPRRERAVRVEKPDGYVTISDLCNASGVLPTHARAALRASGREKPTYGWAFDPKDVPAIKKIVGIK